MEKKQVRLVAKLVPAPNYKVYAGADISGFVDSAGKIFWACSAVLPSGSQATLIFIQEPGKQTRAVVPTNDRGLPLINARGEFNGVANGKIYLTAWDKTDEKNPSAYMYEIDEASINPTPTPAPSPVSNVDQTARDAAANALSKATTALAQATNAMNLAKAAHDVADAALNKVNTATVTVDVVWQKINDRLFGLISAISTNDRTDALNTAWQDVLFKKTNDWVYGQLKDRGLIK
jgi:hypothetical protein